MLVISKLIYKSSLALQSSNARLATRKVPLISYNKPLVSENINTTISKDGRQTIRDFIIYVRLHRSFDLLSRTHACKGLNNRFLCRLARKLPLCKLIQSVSANNCLCIAKERHDQDLFYLITVYYHTIHYSI